MNQKNATIAPPGNLQALLSAAEPAALLVPSRLLRRIIKEHYCLPGLGLMVPHRHICIISRESLVDIVHPEEVGWPAGKEMPPLLYLLSSGDDLRVRLTPERAALRLWRLLFHARVDRAMAERLADGRLTEHSIRSSIERIGQVEFEEACRVMQQENLLLPAADLRFCFSEFVAFFLEVWHFDRPLLTNTLPAIEDPVSVAGLLTSLIDADELYLRSQISGAIGPPACWSHGVHLEHPEESGEEAAGPADPGRSQRLLTQAEAVSSRGNVVRAAILKARAAHIASAEQVETVRRGAIAELDRLVNRLQAALELHDREAEEWRSLLPALLGPASRGIWPHSARLLYDLQKVCVDHERDLYAVNLVETVVSFGQIPLKRPVPLQADVLLVKHLRSAANRLGKIRIGERERRRATILLRSAVHHCESRLRERVRPLILRALEEVGFQPANTPERVAQRKIVEELLDRVTERGFLTMGDLRDAVSRNQLKLRDVSGPKEFLLGDSLLRADKRLTATLDGVYHRGEFYLRLLQGVCSLFFGTLIGRWLSLFLLLPFGAAFATIVFAEELLHLSQAAINFIEGKSGSKHDPGLPPLWPVLGLGVFFLLILHWPGFRHIVWVAIRAVGTLIHRLLFEWPGAFLRLSAIQKVLQSRPVILFRRIAMKPLLLGGLAALVCWAYGADGMTTAIGAGVTFLVIFLLLNSRVGRRLEDLTTDWLSHNWYWLRVDVLGGLLHWIIWFFRECLDRLERVIYTVDEWLRFRQGESRWALTYKAVLGFLWFVVTYVFRIIINLFVEPTVNPIKHFPAVTVGAKLIIPMIPSWISEMTALFKPVLGVGMAGTLATTIVVLLPGIFGFAVWEFKENWRLYRANRSRRLRPVMIGSHGETMLRLLKPGFHSGTLPKLYARLLRAEKSGDGRKLHRQHEALHHVEEAIGRFVERELLFLLEESKAWGGFKTHIGAVHTATNRVRVELCDPLSGTANAWLTFAERAGWLVAEVSQEGWLRDLAASQRTAFQTTLAGLYKKAGVHLVREQIIACLPSADYGFTITAHGLVFWPGTDYGKEQEQALDEQRPDRVVLPLDRMVFDRQDIEWEDWVAAWQRDLAGEPLALAAKKEPEAAG